MELTVTTAKAAEVIGIGYEGLRSYLKRGLLGPSGLLTPVVHPESPAPDLSSVRSKWTRFGFTDLCLMRLAKKLMDVGLSFDVVNGIVSGDEMRQFFREDRCPSDTHLLTWPPYQDYILFSPDQLHHLPDRLNDLAKMGVVNVLIHFAPIWDEVHATLSAVTSTQEAKV